MRLMPRAHAHCRRQNDHTRKVIYQYSSLQFQLPEKDCYCDRALAMKAVKRKVWSPQAAAPPAGPLPPPQPQPQPQPQPPADDEEDLMILSDDETSRDGANAMGGPVARSQVQPLPLIL